MKGGRIPKPVEWEVKKNGCWICTSHYKDHNGYVQIGYDGKLDLLHRVVYKAKNGPIPKGYFVCHRCDNPSCINPEHLFVGTSADNTRDAALKDRLGQKLNNEKVKRILKLLQRGESRADIAREYGVDHTMIGFIARGKWWKHIRLEYDGRKK